MVQMKNTKLMEKKIKITKTAMAIKIPVMDVATKNI